MKKFFYCWLLFLLCLLPLKAQRVVVYSEGFGTGGSNVPVTEYKGWDVASVDYQGTGKVGYTASNVCDIEGSSGKGYVYFSNSSINSLEISGIDVSGFTGLQFYCNLKTPNSDEMKITVSYRVDGGVYKKMTDLKEPYSGWYTSGTRFLSSGKTLDLVITRDDKYNGTIYLDDLTITGIPDVTQSPEAPQISPQGGSFYGLATVSLSSETSAAKIYYTLDGAQPDAESTLYQEPFVLKQDAVVSAVAIAGNLCSEVTTASFQIMDMPVVSTIADFREQALEDSVCLSLQAVPVVHSDGTGVYIQDATGGLILPAGAVSALVGQRLSGTLVGKMDENQMMPIVSEGEWEHLVCDEEIKDVLPLTISLNELTEKSEDLLACFLQIEQLRWNDEEQMLQDEAGNVLNIRTSGWELEETWNWPSLFYLKGVLMKDETGMYLWVEQPSQIIEMNPVEEREPLGRTLVLEERNGFFAATTDLVSNSLKRLRIGVISGRAIAGLSNIDKLLWTIDNQEGTLRTPDGRYLSSDNKDADLYLATEEDEDCIWERHPEMGYWMKNQNDQERAIMYMTGGAGCRLYKLSNVGKAGYSLSPANDMPLYEGYLRLVTVGRWGTVCMPYAVRTGDFSGASFYEIEGKEVASDGRVQAIYLSEPRTQLEAGVSYLFYSDSDLLAALYSGKEVSMPISRNGLVGTFSGINVEQNPDDTTLEGMYVMSDNQLHPCLPGSWMSPNRAYVDMSRVPELQSPSAGMLRISMAGIETGMNVSQVLNPRQESHVYSLQGVFLGRYGELLGRLKKGVYLVEGQKIIVK